MSGKSPLRMRFEQVISMVYNINDLRLLSAVYKFPF
jgi:hypothetical protein